MNRSGTLGRATTSDGSELVLHYRGGVHTLRVDGLELMSSRSHGSESALARLGCAGLPGRAPRVLVGGLGFGYTLRSALDQLPEDAVVVVSEIFASLLRWHRDPDTGLGELAGFPLDDPRVEVKCADVWERLAAREAYDAIFLDVDNGPWAFTVRSNDRLYEKAGLERIADSLRPGGRLAVWSAGDAPDFAQLLADGGFAVETHRVAARGGTAHRHTILVGVKERPSSGARPPDGA